MRYNYARSEITSVPPPIGLAAPAPAVPVDTLQELINRKREQEKNRLKYHLTEADCNLICTNATELHYTSGQIIAGDGTNITAVYRIKCGKISLVKAGVKLYDLTQGYFIGEGLFIRGEAKDVFGASLIANGPVILSEVNLPFVRQLLEVDKVLAFKIYRHMAGKLSALLLSMIYKVTSDPPPSPTISAAAQPLAQLSRSDSFSSSSSEGSGAGSGSAGVTSEVSSGSLTPGTTGSDGDLAYPPRAAIMSGEMVASGRVVRRKSCKITAALTSDTPFKVYQLDGTQTCQLTGTKIIVTGGGGFRSKRKIKYNKILDLSKTGKNSVTIIYNVQAKTIFFKSEEDLNEFFGLVQSLIVASTTKQTQYSPGPISPIQSPGSPLDAPPPPPPVYPLNIPVEAGQVAEDKKALHNFAVRQDLVKGDVVVAEGDLYQRIYTVVSGQMVMKKGDRTLLTVEEGEVFGVLTLFHLRPSFLTIEVASDTATLLVIPAFRIYDLLQSNFPLAVRVHKKSAQLLYTQVEKLLLSREGVVKGFSDAHVLL